MKLKDKVAIVTGSRRGIGAAIALEFAKEGANLVVSDIDLNSCKKVCSEIKKLGRECLALKCDVSKKKDVDNMIKKTVQKFKKIDILVNNAGVLILKPFEKMTEKDWDFVLDINLKGVFLCSNAVAKHMMKRRYGKIISIASVAGEVGFENASAYCTSKAGIINLTKELAIELAPYNINVNAIAPGVIDTNMTKGMLADKKSRKMLFQNISMGREGQPWEIGKGAVYLASDESSYVVGHTLVIDGGWIIH